MMFRTFVLVALVLIVAGASAFLVEGGITVTPWIVVPVLAVFGLILAGVAGKRRRGTRTPLATLERRVKLHTRDLATQPPPGPKTEGTDRDGD